MKLGQDNTTMNLWAVVCELCHTSPDRGNRAYQINKLVKKAPQLKSCYS